MRAVVQRVKGAKVDVTGRTVGEIGPGLLVFLAWGRVTLKKTANTWPERSLI